MLGYALSHSVESRRGAVARAVMALFRFLSPLIEPDLRISRIRLSGWFHAMACGAPARWALR
jgi:hypothetical protein